MKDFYLIDCKKKLRWKNFLKDRVSNPGQTWQYSYFEDINNNYRTFLLVINLDKKNYFCPFHLKEENNKKKLFSIRGYSGFNTTLNHTKLSQIKLLLKKNNIDEIYFTSNPYILEDKEIKKISSFKNNAYLINLNLNIEAIYNNFSQNIKRNIKKGEKIDQLKTEKYKIYNIKEILSLYNLNLARLNLSENQLYLKKSLKFLLNLPKKNNLIICSKYKNKLVALSLFNLSDSLAYYHFHIASENYNFLSSKHIYEAIKILKKREYKLINLGGPVNNQPGVERFKESISTVKKKILSYYLNIKN